MVQMATKQLKMKYKLDDDRKGFHIWLSDAEFAKLLRNSISVGVGLDQYLDEMIFDPVLDRVEKAVQSGSQSDIPEIKIERVK
jgi:hypothetical protein